MDYKLTFSGRFHYRQGSGICAHYHGDYQLQLVYSGEASVHVNGIPYTVSKNSILLVRKDSTHDFTVVSPEGMKTLEIKFVTTDPEMEALATAVKTFSSDDGTLFDILSRIVLEGQRKSPYYREVSNALLMECMAALYRKNGGEPIWSFKSVHTPEDSAGISLSLLGAVDEYIHKNIHKNFSLSDVSAACGYNQDYLYRVIKKQTGYSAVRYIGQKKFEKAKQLIMHTELSLSEIAWNLGFETLYYFSRFFKEYAGIPPSEFSRKVRSAIRTDY